jgi:SAM-dependent methyltransferase
MTAGEHFERVAVAYESLRTTDEAPVRAIGRLLPGRPVTGLDTGCGTGRYTRLLRAVLPDGSLLAAADVSAAMLAQLKTARGHALGVVPLLAAAEELPLRTASLDLVTAFNCVHHFDLGRFLAAAARVLQPGGQLFIYTRTPQQNARTIWGRYFPGFTEHEQRLHSQAAISDAVRRTDGLTMVAAQTFQHPRTSTAERLGAQAQGRHYSTFSFYTPQELRAAITIFLARLPSPEVCWVDEHLLVIATASRHDQAEPDGPASPANQAIKDQPPQIRAGRAGEAPDRRPGGRAQIIPISNTPRGHHEGQRMSAERRVRARSSTAVDDAVLQDGWLGSQATRRSSRRTTLFSTIRTLAKAIKFWGANRGANGDRRRATPSDGQRQ